MPDPGNPGDVGNKNNINTFTSAPPQAGPGGGLYDFMGNHGGNQAFNVAGGTGGDLTGGKMTTQEGGTYGELYGRSQGMGNYFNQLAAGYNQQAPTVGEQSQLSSLNDYYLNALQGNGPSIAQTQLQSATDQTLAAQMAAAASARGGAAARVGAERAAQLGAGTQMAQAANQSAMLRAQEQQAAAQGLMGVGTAELQRAQNNAALQQTNQNQINQMQTALYGMGEQEQGMSLSEQQAYMANLLAAEGIQTQQSQFNTQLGTQIAGAGMQMVGAGINAASDERLKTDVQSQGGNGISSVYGGSSYDGPSAPNLQPKQSMGDLYSHALNTQPQAPIVDVGKQAGTGAGIGAATGAATGALSGGPTGALAGAAGGALQGGLASAAHADPNDPALKAANTATQAGIGAATGAATGATLGPIGAGVGGVIGGVAGLLKGLL